MRGVGIIAGALLAWALGLMDGEALARVQSPHVATSMAPGADPEQLQSAIIEWIRVTASSSQFLVGLAAGVALAESGRFALRWLCRALGGATAAAKFVVQHRLIAIAAASAGYYVFARLVFSS